MASYLPVFTFLRSESDHRGGLPTEGDVEALIRAGDRNQFWVSCSRNDWHAKVMCRLIADSPEYAPLAYITQMAAMVSAGEQPAARDALRKLLADIEREPERITPETRWTGYDAQQVLEFLCDSRPMRDIHEDLIGDIPALFCFMKTQLEVLEAALREGKLVLYFRLG